MSAKILHAISDDPNLEKQFEKQIGCMTGIFQLFDRHQILTVKRLYSHKKLPASRSSSSCESPRPDGNIAAVQHGAGDDTRISSVDSVGRFNAEPSSRGPSRAASVDCGSNGRLSASLQELTPLEKLEAAARSSWDFRAAKSMNTKNSGRLSVDSREDASILSKVPPISSLDSRQPGRLSFDIRDVVRDSFYRDNPKLSVETKIDDRAQSREGHKYVLKPKDSPRPPMDLKDTSKHQQSPLSLAPKLGQKPKSQIQASTDVNGKPRPSSDKAADDAAKRSRSLLDLNESMRVLAKLKEAPWNYVESKEPPRPSFESREGTRFSYSKDSPRFSCDNKENPRSSSLKLREPPRLSLDSREVSRNFVDLRRNSSVKDTASTNHKHSHSSGDFIEMEQQYSERKRSPSVVARLMGLEEMPADSTPTSQKREISNQWSSEENSGSRTSAEVRKSSQYCNVVESPRQSKEKENNSFELKKSHNIQPRFSTDRSNIVEETFDRMLASPRTINSLTSPRLKHPDAVPKPVSTQRCPVETAPWRQQDSCHTYKKKAVEAQSFLPDVTKKNEGASRDLYSEIEKRLKQLELEHCDKDLKTLKQILEAMQHKGLLDSTKERFSRHQNDGDYTPRSRIFQEAKPISRTCEMQSNPMKPGTCNSARAYEAPIVVMKPAKLVIKPGSAAVVPTEGFPNSPRKVGSINQPGIANTKRSTMTSNRALNDQQSGKPNYRESSYRHSNELVSSKHHKREQISRTMSEEYSSQVLQKGRPRSPSPASSPPTRNQQAPKETMNSPKNSNPSYSPKAQRKKPEMERKPRQPVSRKSGRQGTKQIGPEAESPSTRNRMKTKRTSALRLEAASECSRDTVEDQCPDTPRADEISVRSDSNISSISHMDYEITSSERSYTSKFSDVNAEYDCKFNRENYQSLQSTGSTDASPVLKKRLDFRTDCKTSSTATTNGVCEDLVKSKDEGMNSKMEELQLNQCEELSISSTAPEVSEQPSPVSVLDASLFYKDDSSPSPVKKCLITFKEDETRQEVDSPSNTEHWSNFKNQSYDQIPESPLPPNNKLLRNVRTLVRKLEDLNKPTEEGTIEDPQIKSLIAQNEAPDYKYLIEILSASGLLQEDRDPIQPIEFHASGYPVNPELFHVLEQKRGPQQFGSKKYHQEKIDRETLFGTVNDILRKKFSLYLQLQPWVIQQNSVIRRRPCGEQLVKEVWYELQEFPCSACEDLYDTLRGIVQKDLTDNEDRWCDYGTEIGEVVLDVERMIFKDLIDETMRALGLRQSRPAPSTYQTVRTKRQLTF